ncbi:MAG TPA: histidine phosphatase family protein [Gaiellaceae bacterium]|nr:histidine phosphatase family protein [Gaiellaceae bacterium]
MTVLYLARHGQSDWNAANRFQGHTDRPLTDLGRKQADALARELAPIALAAIYSSPLLRAFDTAEAVAAGRDLGVVAEDGLREVDVGSWAGLTRAEVEERYPAGFRRWIDGGEGWEDGETYDRMSTRVLATTLRIVRAHEHAEILVVSHGGPIRAIHAAAEGMTVHEYRRLSPVEPNARLTRVVVDDGRFARLGS